MNVLKFEKVENCFPSTLEFPHLVRGFSRFVGSRDVRGAYRNAERTRGNIRARDQARLNRRQLIPLRLLRPRAIGVYVIGV